MPARKNDYLCTRAYLKAYCKSLGVQLSVDGEDYFDALIRSLIIRAVERMTAKGKRITLDSRDF